MCTDAGSDRVHHLGQGAGGLGTLTCRSGLRNSMPEKKLGGVPEDWMNGLTLFSPQGYGSGGRAVQRRGSQGIPAPRSILLGHHPRSLAAPAARPTPGTRMGLRARARSGHRLRSPMSRRLSRLTKPTTSRSLLNDPSDSGPEFRDVTGERSRLGPVRGTQTPPGTVVPAGGGGPPPRKHRRPRWWAKNLPGRDSDGAHPTANSNHELHPGDTLIQVRSDCKPN